MPEMDGLQMSRKILEFYQEKAIRHQTQIWAVTAMNEDFIGEDASVIGLSGVCLKPMSKGVLEKILRESNMI